MHSLKPMVYRLLVLVAFVLTLAAPFRWGPLGS